MSRMGLSQCESFPADPDAPFNKAVIGIRSWDHLFE